MVTAKIGGSTSPCTKRQKIMVSRLGESALIAVGITSAIMAPVMTRFRPITSAIAPVNGAVNATQGRREHDQRDARFGRAEFLLRSGSTLAANTD